MSVTAIRSPRSASAPTRSSLDLRTALPAGVLARPFDDCVERHAWVLVAETLEATAHALACWDEGVSPSVVEVLIGHAEHVALRAEDAVAGAAPGPDRRRRRSDAVRTLTVERSWLRLAALLVGPAPADAELLVPCVRQHRDALSAWRNAPLAAV